MSNVKALGCGAYHSMVVVVGDVVYACGLNNYGQLGLGDNDTEARDYLVRTFVASFLCVLCAQYFVDCSFCFCVLGVLFSFSSIFGSFYFTPFSISSQF